MEWNDIDDRLAEIHCSVHATQHGDCSACQTLLTFGVQLVAACLFKQESQVHAA